MIFLTLVAFAVSSNLEGIPITSQNAPFFILIFAIALIMFIWFWKFCISYYRGKFREFSGFLDGKSSSKWGKPGFAEIYKKINFTIDYVEGDNSYLEIKITNFNPYLEEDFKREKLLMVMESLYLLTNRENAK